MHSRRSHLVLIGLILAALTGALLLAVPGAPGHRKATLGLDLQGGLEVVLKAVPPKGHKLTPEDISRSVNIMRSRIDSLGVSEPEIRKQGSNQIVVELPGVHNATKAAKIIGQTAQLQLYDLEVNLTGPSITTQGLVTVPAATTSLYNLLASVQAKAKQGTPSAFYLFGAKKRLLAGPVDTRPKLFSSVRRSVPKGGKVLAVPQKMTVLTCGSTEVVCPGQGQGGLVNPPPAGSTYYYLFKHDPAKGIPEMTGNDLKLSGTRQDFDPQTNSPNVLIAFTHAGGKKFHKITRDEWLRGKLQNSPQHFAIVLDGEIRSFPQIDYTDSSLSDGIDPINGAQITGIGSVGEAKDLAIVLQSGALPVSFVRIR